VAVKAVASERRGLSEGGTAGFLRAVDCRPREMRTGGKMVA
jgi:hypothetical protein